MPFGSEKGIINICFGKIQNYLKTAAGSTLLIRPKAKDAPPIEIKHIVENMPSKTGVEKEKIRPELATPDLNPSSIPIPSRKPTIEKTMAWVRISLVM